MDEAPEAGPAQKGNLWEEPPTAEEPPSAALPSSAGPAPPPAEPGPSSPAAPALPAKVAGKKRKECEAEGCSVVPVFNFPGEATGRFCKAHRWVPASCVSAVVRVLCVGAQDMGTS